MSQPAFTLDYLFQILPSFISYYLLAEEEKQGLYLPYITTIQT